MEQNEMRNLIENWLEAWNSGNEDKIMSIYDDNAILYQAPMKKTLIGKNYILARYRDFAEMSKDSKITLHELLVSENKVVLELNISGTHTGRFLDYEPTNRKLDIDTCVTMEFKDNKVIKHTTYLDTASILRALDLIEVPGTRAEAA